MRLSGVINFYFMIKKKSMYIRDMVNLGFVKIGDLISANNFFLYSISSLINLEERFFLMRIKSSITTEWRLVIKTSVEETIADLIQIIPTIKMVSGNEVPILGISPKQIY